MPSLIRCKTCGANVSFEAEKCPRCGEPDFIDKEELNQIHFTFTVTGLPKREYVGGIYLRYRFDLPTYAASPNINKRLNENIDLDANIWQSGKSSFRVFLNPGIRLNSITGIFCLCNEIVIPDSDAMSRFYHITLAEKMVLCNIKNSNINIAINILSTAEEYKEMKTIVLFGKERLVPTGQMKTRQHYSLDISE